MKWSSRPEFFSAARVSGYLPCSRVLQTGRLEEDAEKDTGLQSNDECFCNAVCGDNARKTSSPKGHRRLTITGKLSARLEAVQQHN